METNNVSIFGPNLICCCVDGCESETFRGRLYCSGVKEPILFKDAYQLLLRMEDYFDEIRFPMASTTSRSFSGRRPSTPYRRGGKLVQDKNVTNHKGKKATFIVQVQYRQNATWQGKIVWTEQDKTQYFRSALEMLKLMDSALEEEAVLQPEAEAANE